MRIHCLKKDNELTTKFVLLGMSRTVSESLSLRQWYSLAKFQGLFLKYGLMNATFFFFLFSFLQCHFTNNWRLKETNQRGRKKKIHFFHLSKHCCIVSVPTNCHIVSVLPSTPLLFIELPFTIGSQRSLRGMNICCFLKLLQIVHLKYSFSFRLTYYKL